jgi:hypothetical protein
MHLPDFNAAGELSDCPIDTNFNMGPGVSPQGDLLWDPNSQDSNFYQLKMKAFVSVSASPPAQLYNDGQGGKLPLQQVAQQPLPYGVAPN